MPVSAQSLDNNLGDRAFALAAFGAVSVGMAAHTPCVSLLFHERCS